jgi:probable rRNA maturation factor
MNSPSSGVRVWIQNAAKAPIRVGAVRGPIIAAAALPELRPSLPAQASLTVRIAGDRLLRRLNSEFLGEDHATDVLSFPAGGQEGYLGDVAISWPAVGRQAAEHRHSVEAELGLLAVHGFLHLVGYDHSDATEERVMRRLTLAALESCGIRLADGRL